MEYAYCMKVDWKKPMKQKTLNIFHKVSEDILQSDIPKLYPSINWFFFFFYKTHNISEKDAIKLASLAAQ